MGDPAWIGLALTVGLALLAAFGFGLKFFASKEEVNRLWAEVDRVRARLHDISNEILVLIDRRDRHGDE